MRAALRLLLLMQTLEAFAYYTLGNVLTLHLTSIYGVSDTAAGVHFGIRSALTTVYATLFGPIIDWFGPFRMLPIAFALAAIGRAIFAQVDSLSLALAAIYLPMAAGHGLTNAAFIICIKRITSSSTSPTRPPDTPWGFALQYCALVLGIAICGPTIDIVTARWAPAPPYRALAFLSAVCSVLGLGASLVLLPIAPPSPKMMHSRGGAATAAEAVQVALEAFAELRRTACTARFVRYTAFSIAILPGHSVLRNLDGGLFPKFMLRTFGPAVPKGSIYAINPLLDLLAVPLLSQRLAHVEHFPLVRLGLSIAAAAPLLLVALPATLATVVAFVLMLTAGDALYNPRLSAYAMDVAPLGKEGAFAGLSAAVAFLAELPAGLLGGWLLDRYCSAASYDAQDAQHDAHDAQHDAQDAQHDALDPHGCDARGLFGSLGAFALLTPLALWATPWLLREPLGDGPLAHAHTRGAPIGDDGCEASGFELTGACDEVVGGGASPVAEESQRLTGQDG